MDRTALIIGATGGIGGAVLSALLAHGWKVRALHRNPEEAARRFPHLRNITWLKGDAMHAPDVVAAASGASVVFHGANPPGYKNWRSTAIPMLKSSIEAARAANARLVLPGNVYNFGEDAGSVVDESAPQNPRTRKGAIRVEMEAMLRDAAVRGLVVRAGDFFGASAPASWMQNVLVKPGRAVRSVTYPGEHDVGHAWAYLPDLAETMARLLDREAELGDFEVFHFEGQYMTRGVEFAEAIRRAASAPTAPIKAFPWTALLLLSPFVTLFRELLEMRYLWKVPLRLDNRKLVAFLGEEPRTPLDTALRASLEGLGCRERPRPVTAAA